MKINYEKFTYTLSTGKEFYANRGLLSPDPITEELYGGYDEHIPEFTPIVGEDLFTPAERQEIAKYMIELWKQWACR